MALDELHARRLATVASIFESALDRMELVLKSLESPYGDGPCAGAGRAYSSGTGKDANHSDSPGGVFESFFHSASKA